MPNKFLPPKYTKGNPNFTLPADFNAKVAMKDIVKMFNPFMAIPYNAEDFYSGAQSGDYMKSGMGALGLLGAATPFAPAASAQYAKSTMPLRNAQINIEATSPAILQGANASRQGQFLSDLRYDTARKAASDSGMKMANAPVTKTQGIWVDPETLAEEFNRVYSQNIGRLPKTPIEFNPQVKAYAESMGGDLGQWGVGASRFSPLPFNINKQAANSILYPKATAKDIIEAGKKLNPKGGVVSATPQGGMIVFNPEVTMTTQEMASQLKNVSSKPRYGLLDSNLFMTNEVPQGNYMSNVDDLIRGLGY